ncbi:TPA_asm: matrix protein [Caribbean watersnake bornavirus]|uniref:Matrix protein n=1 Tax=Caribbean watersnake bornavirus TaxID=2817570 RepID=A0A8D9UJ98_9MONO|nr:TPA_asm: matrix protein [Caribbean watersnake bornavirus]
MPKHEYTELKDKVIIPGWKTLMLEIDFVGGSHNQFIHIPLISVKEEFTLQRQKRLSDYLTIDVEPSGHSTARVYMLFDDFLITSLNNIAVYKNPIQKYQFVELSDTQSEHAINAFFNVFAYRLRNVGVGPLGPDIRAAGP